MGGKRALQAGSLQQAGGQAGVSIQAGKLPARLLPSQCPSLDCSLCLPRSSWDPVPVLTHACMPLTKPASLRPTHACPALSSACPEQRLP